MRQYGFSHISRRVLRGMTYKRLRILTLSGIDLRPRSLSRFRSAVYQGVYLILGPLPSVKEI